MGEYIAKTEKISQKDERIASLDTEPQRNAVIDSLTAQVSEYERTSAKTYKSLRSALEDRAKFEAESRKAEAALKKTQESFAKEREQLSQKIKVLEADLTRVTENNDAELQLKEAKGTIQGLEKRLQNAQSDCDYVRDQYQNATTAAGAASKEASMFKEQIDKFKKASEVDIVRIHQIYDDSAKRAFVEQIKDLQILLRERDVEIDRLREERQNIIRNGRRDTRGASVPRSPHMGVISPRPPRFGGNSSRGTSPAGATMDGITPMPPLFTQQGGNGRLSHLRQ